MALYGKLMAYKSGKGGKAPKGGAPKGSKPPLEPATEGVLPCVVDVAGSCFVSIGEAAVRSVPQGQGDKGKGKKGKGHGQANVHEFPSKCNKCCQWGHRASNCPGAVARCVRRTH